MISLRDIQTAAERILPIAKRTPVLTSESFDARSGLRAFFKCENFQKGGAFKIRGAANMIFSLSAEQLRNGVVAFSSGNHAQATALAARHMGTPATIVMPLDAPRSKVAATRAYGAEIVTYDRFKEDRIAIGKRIAAETGATLVPPFDHELIMAGQGTATLELLEEVPDIEALVVCIGGGGLISGSAVAATETKPGIRVFGVEPEDANDTFLSLQQGKRVEIAPPKTIADGLRPTSPGELTFPIIRERVEQVVLVTDDEIRETVKYLLARMKMLVEPSGAVPAAAVLFGKLPAGLRRVGIIVSGGNVDLDVLAAM
ncbi:MAG TPA: pyridoxal-phosphate dependent enzyme [Bryobacteraceae bacterium]|nr:pyridoxal-phosphate dependent enzyme [Bryobacteraceae bacterium]